LITIGVIPARYESSRFKGKLLFKIAGKSVIRHVYDRALECKSLDRVIIASDDSRIVDHAVGFGAETYLSKKKHTCGTERVAEAVARKRSDVIVNIQGDEVLIRPEVVESAIGALLSDKDADCGTVCHEIASMDDFRNPDLVKVVIDRNCNALYFSRSPIPYLKGGKRRTAPLYGHIGVYAFRRDALMRFTRLKRGTLEAAESLEQLRILESGMRIKVNLTKFKNISLNRKRDVPLIRNILESE
jgi:3-deoxy-manno-octulosonate cytidylyltransferase (CMP-KDO synthetase)